MASRHYNDPTYRNNRKAILEGNPYCAWCKTRRATTADHIIEVDRGGDHSLGNLVPACQKCNSSRGASYVNAKTNARVKARQTASKAATPRRVAAEPVFGAEGFDPGRSSSKNLPKTGQKRPRRPASVAIDPDADGSTPRLQTPIRGVRSHGPDVCRWIETHMGFTPMPWQRTALAGQLEYDTPGFPLFRTSLVSVARQNGKSVCLAGLLGWWLTEGAVLRKQPQTVVTTAHTLDLAVSLFQTMAPILETRFGGEAKWSFGRNQLTMPDGSLWLVRAATGSAGHGRSIDLVLIDEAWDINADVIDQGLLPAQRARKHPLCSMWSTAGTEASVAMLRFRSQGLAAIDAGSPGSHYMAEWSVPENVDPADSAYWRMANPAIGHTLDLEVLEAEAAGPNQSAFLRASLNMWVSTDKAWLDPGVWERCAITGPAGAPAVLAIDSSQDGQRFVGVTAHPTADGQIVLRVAFSVSTESELWRHVDQVMTVPACQLAVTPALQIHVPPGLARRSTTVGYAELTKWTTLVKSMILDGRVGHIGQLTLTEHMARAVAVKTNSGWTLSSQKSPGPIELARCAIWAAALSTKPKWTARPAMAAGRM